jgi:uncharacterized membrane protein YdbT with pleckstrin-like domain
MMRGVLDASEQAMNPTTPLKIGAIAFTVLWTGLMVWWSGSFAVANIVILTICGALACYLWYRFMRYWQFRRMSKQQ